MVKKRHVQVNKKTSSKKRNLIIGVVIILLILGLIIIFNFAGFKSPLIFKYLSLSPALNFQGLPSNFIPSVGYYHALNNKVVSLWDGRINYVSVNGGQFTAVSESSLVSQGLPSTFTPRVGYYHPFNGGRISLFDANGVLYSKGGTQTTFTQVDRKVGSALANAGLPPTFKPIVGFYHIFSGGRVFLIDANANYAIWIPSTNKWTIINKETMNTNYGLPKLGEIIPIDGYYYEFSSSSKGVHLWYLIDDVPKVYSWSGSGKFVEITSQITGLPENPDPKVVYFDAFSKRIILWNGLNAYSSSNGKDFTLIHNGILVAETCKSNLAAESTATYFCSQAESQSDCDNLNTIYKCRTLSLSANGYSTCVDQASESSCIENTINACEWDADGNPPLCVWN